MTIARVLKHMTVCSLILLSWTAEGICQQDSRDAAGLQPSDAVRITVWPNAELGGTFIVDEAGRVQLPFLGETLVTGRSLDSLREQLREGYSRAMQTPIITVEALYRIAVLGEVNRPGLYFIPPSDGVFDVLAQAGGFTRTAEERELSVVRESEVIIIDALRAFEVGDLLPVDALMLRSGDNIVVPARREGLGLRDWLAIGNFIMSALLLYDRIAN